MIRVVQYTGLKTKIKGLLFSARDKTRKISRFTVDGRKGFSRKARGCTSRNKIANKWMYTAVQKFRISACSPRSLSN